MVVFVAATHLRFRKSGASSNNLGGIISVNEVTEVGLHTVFPAVSETETSTGLRDYQALYLYNSHTTVPAKNIVVFSRGTKSTYTTLRYGFDPVGFGDGDTTGRAQIIANKTTTPAGVVFREGVSRTDDDVLDIGDLAPLKAICIWFERTILANTRPEEDDNITIVVETNNVKGDTGITTDTGIQNVVVTGQTETTDNLTHLHNCVNSVGSITNYFFLGNTTTNTNASQWINNLGAYYLKDICKFVFGYLDVSNVTKRNQLVNGCDRGAVNGYQHYIKKNVSYVLIDTSGFQSYINPSTQYTKVAEALESANRNATIDFIVVLIGSSAYGALPGNDSTVKLDADLRKHYHPLFTKWGVHLVIQSGINNYQRHDILGYNAADPVTPTRFFTSSPPNYTIAAGLKNFGATGSLFVTIGTGGRTPVHSIPSVPAYTPFSYVPKGVGYLQVLTTQRTASSVPVLEGKFYDYYVTATSDTSSATGSALQRVKVLVDRFTIANTT